MYATDEINAYRMVDARQFFGKQDMSATLVAMGFNATASSPQ